MVDNSAWIGYDYGYALATYVAIAIAILALIAVFVVTDERLAIFKMRKHILRLYIIMYIANISIFFRKVRQLFKKGVDLDGQDRRSKWHG